jgi:hypothetical protein
MDGDSTRKRVLVAQGLAALAYFFCAHGAHAATNAKHAQVVVARAHAGAAAIQPRRT